MTKKHTITVLNLLAGVVCLIPNAEAKAPLSGSVGGSITISGKRKAGEAVVWLDGSVKSLPVAHAMVDQRNKTFWPHVSVVTRGTKIDFPNDDSVFHNVYAYFQAKKFDLGMYPHGSTKSVTFDKTGLVSLLCNVHSDMSAYIMVVDTPYYTVADTKGHYEISSVPPGVYTLHCWHESGAVTATQITVGSTPLPVELSISRK